jgi:hypothetical protein
VDVALEDGAGVRVLPAAEALVLRGAAPTTSPRLRGWGDSTTHVNGSGRQQRGRHRALALAAQHGHVEVVSLLLDAGEDPDRYNPKGNHAHTTPLHQAVWSGHEESCGCWWNEARAWISKDTIYEATPLGWATYGGREAIADYLAPGRPPAREPTSMPASRS